MGVPLLPLAAAYGLGLGHLAGVSFSNRFMRPSSQLQVYNHPHTTSSAPRTTSAPTSIKASGEPTSTQQTMKRFRNSGSRTKRSRRFRRRVYRPRRTLTPFTLTRWLPTATYFALNPGAGTVDSKILYLNSAHDPTGTVSATQSPLGFNQYEALYQRYCIIAYKITFEIVSTDNTHPLIFGFTPSRDVTVLSSWQHYKELPGTVQRVITPDVDKNYIKVKGSIKKWLAPKGSKMLSNEELCAQVTANPSRTLFGHVYVQAMDGAADPASVHVAVRMSQMTVFFEPVIPARSTQ